MPQTEARRSLVAVMCKTPEEGELSILEDAVGAFSRVHTILPPPPGKRWDVKTACSEALMSGAELVLLLADKVHLSRSDVSGLLENYEAGARIVTGDRRSGSTRVMHHLAGLMTGSRRQDFESPVRLYDSGALTEVLEHLPDLSQHPMLLMSVVEHRLRFAVRELRLRNPEVPGAEKPPLQTAGDLLKGLVELCGFLGSARRIR